MFIDEDSVIVTSVDYAGFFAWAENATVDGFSMKVLGSPLQIDDDDVNEQKMYLNYPRGNHIYHDPIMGVMTLPEAFLDTTLIVIVSFVAIVGIAGIVLVVILRRRRND